MNLENREAPKQNQDIKENQGCIKGLCFSKWAHSDLSLSHDVKQLVIFQKLWGRQYHSTTVPDFARNTGDVQSVM